MVFKVRFKSTIKFNIHNVFFVELVLMRWMYYHVVWVVMLFGWLMVFMNRLVISPLLIPIMKELNLTYTEVSLLVTAYFYAYILMQIPAGYLGDKLGRKKVLIVGNAIWSFASVFTGLAQSFLQIFGFRLVTGLGQGTYFGNDRPLIALNTPKEKMGFGQGLSLTGMCVGMALGVGLGGYFAQNFGWRLTFAFFAVPAFIICFLVWKLIKEPKTDYSASQNSRSSFYAYSLVFRKRNFWLVSLAGFFSIFIFYFLITWTPAIFLDFGVKTLAEASVYSALFGFSGVPGLVIVGLVSDFFIRRGWGRKIVLMITYFAGAFFMVLFALSLEGKFSLWFLVLTVFLIGFFLWGTYPIIYAVISEVAPHEVGGVAFGFSNTIMMIGAALSPWIGGLIRDLTGSFTLGVYMLSLLSAIAGLTVFLVKEEST